MIFCHFSFFPVACESSGVLYIYVYIPFCVK
nr:MAG TPA: hypothetical protein [Caudoviricetes sp.]